MQFDLSSIVSAQHFLLQATQKDVQEFRWLSALPGWVFLLVIVPLVVLFVRFVYTREALRSSGAVRWTLISLRVLIVLSVVLMLAEPVMRTTKFLSQDSTILVIADDSLSMDIADKYSDRKLVEVLAEFFRSTEDTVESTSRYDLIRRLFRDQDIRFLARLREKGQVAFFTFAGGIQRLEQFPRRQDGDPPSAEAEAIEVFPDYEVVRIDGRVQQTRIADGLLDAVNSVRAGGFGSSEENIAGIVLLTDGQETGGSSSAADVARRFAQRNIPIYTIGVGNPADPKDIRVTNLDVNDVVLAKDKVPFDAAIIADGYEGERVRVELKFDGRVVDTDTVVLEGGGRRQTVRLDYSPPDPGEFIATVEVENRGGELFKDNNSISKPIRVLDQKIRVLFADGPPRWEYRYLKNALIRDPTMEAQVFLFSADRQFIQESSSGVPPLTAFPDSKEELFSYHVIIIGDVDVDGGNSQRYLTPQQMKLIKEFVYEAGGGVVFISGENANPSKYRDTDLYSLLPVDVPDREFSWVRSDAPISDPFNVRLTPAGKEHGVMRLDNDFDKNIELWENPRGRAFENLPGFYWFYEVGAPKSGTVVLARHPDKSRHALDEEGLAIFAFMNYGKGRTFFSAVDNTWRWRAGVDNRYFYRFWGQVARFCATGRLLGKTPRYSLNTDKSSYTLGETVSVEARVFDANMRPSSAPTVVVYHSAKGDEGGGPDQTELNLDPVRGQGTYHGTVVASRLGEHKLWLGSEDVELAFRPFSVTVPAVELRDPRRNQTLLKVLAANSGGEFFELYDVEKVIEKLDGHSQSQQGSFEDDPLWDDLWLLFAFTGLIAAEWILRRLYRLL